MSNRTIKVTDGSRHIMVEETRAVFLIAEGLVCPQEGSSDLHTLGTNTLEDVRDFLKNKADKCDGRLVDVSVAIVITTECSGHGRQEHVIKVPLALAEKMAEKLKGAHREDVENVDWMQYINPNLN